jgi:hypothetical protein
MEGSFRLFSRTKRAEVDFPGVCRQDRTEGIQVIDRNRRDFLNILTEGRHGGRHEQQKQDKGPKPPRHKNSIPIIHGWFLTQSTKERNGFSP